MLSLDLPSCPAGDVVDVGTPGRRGLAAAFPWVVTWPKRGLAQQRPELSIPPGLPGTFHVHEVLGSQ